MALACPAPPPDAGMVRGLLVSVDCNVQAMAEASYAALARPDSPVAAALTALLTIYIAWFGFRLLIGRAPLRIGDLTLTALKIGVVLTLATSWPSYQALVFDALFRGPEQLAGSLLSAMSGSQSLAANPFDGLQASYDEMQRSAAFLSGRTLGAPSPLQGGPAFAAFALNTSAFMMLMTSMGAVLAAKIVLGLLLGLGPLFVLFLLFDATRGVFEGWLRAALAFALTPLMATLGLVVQLTLIEPHVLKLAELRTQGLVDLAPANSIFVLSMVCTGVSAALFLAVGVIAFSLRLPGHGQTVATSTSTVTTTSRTTPGAVIDARSAPRADVEARAAAVAAAASAMERRDLRTVGSAGGQMPAAGVLRRTSPAGEPAPDAPPLRHVQRRNALPGAAASNRRRDG